LNWKTKTWNYQTILSQAVPAEFEELFAGVAPFIVHLFTKDVLELGGAGDPVQLDVCKAVLVPQIVCKRAGKSASKFVYT